jgi:predicted transcriptional regulator
LHDGDRVWKGIDWHITDRLFEKGLIDNPKNKAKSLSLTPEGIAHARAVLAREFSNAE